MQVGLVGNRAGWYIIKMGSAQEQQGWKGFLYGKENSHGEKVNPGNAQVHWKLLGKNQ